MTSGLWVVEHEYHRPRLGWQRRYFQERHGFSDWIGEIDGAWCKSPKYATKMTEDQARQVALQRAGRAVPLVVVLERRGGGNGRP
jgi:hypothetical protein